MRIAVTLNGADNVGKTTNARWLASSMPDVEFTGTVDRWDRRWAEVSRRDFSQWWFVDSTTDEHIDLVFSSHAARCAGGGPLALEDRGWPMLVATCAATAAVKDGISTAEALAQVATKARRYAPTPRRELHLLLRHSNQPAAEAHHAIAREVVPTTERYVEYQRRLAEAIDLQVDGGEYQAIVVRGDRPLLDVQREIREAVAQLDVPVAPLPPDRIEHLWVLAGMSESGKSTVGELLRTEHTATRLKIGYLMQLAADRLGTADPYREWDELTQAQMLTEEILRFAALNSGSHRISLESAHRFDATAHLRRIWGQRCEILFLRLPDGLRAQRATETMESLSARDAIKQSRGGDRIALIADTVIDNGRSLAALKRVVTEVVHRRSGTKVPPHTDTAIPESLQPVLADCVARLTDSETALVAATGSLAHQGWQPGWSDIDLLVVRDTLPLHWLQTRRIPQSGPAGEKIALSSFTTREMLTGSVPPRVLHALRQIAHDGYGVLYRRSDLVLNAFDAPTDDRASRNELPLVTMVLRRLAANPEPDVRAVYKHVVLTMKIILRADGVDLDGSEEVRLAFTTSHPDADVDLPAVAEVSGDRWRQDETLSHRVRGAAAQILAYHDKLGRTAASDTPKTEGSDLP
ncbi:hypothetical protein FHG89_17990 [Micromonospora orduensis]|uniref:Nucleotidyltransferase domain-containing protein n=1 Tax=Micromonospora orduensis TaxID=1420891 RepID=A0A5C4QK44_9ACTN|nr:hypothetical protein [Micromonospora orduensis]TNH27475.1 hypothetical protein FHG89_17990 [Micromonospora orduensis]